MENNKDNKSCPSREISNTGDRKETGKKEIAKENLGLVHACAKRFKGRGIEYDDLYSAGCVGLLKAIDNFDADRGIRFSTYAVPVILGEIKQLFRDSGTVKVSRGLKELSMKAMRIKDEYMRKYGEEITVNKLSELLQVEPEKLVEALNSSRFPVSLSSFDREGDEYVTEIPVESVEEKLSELLSLRQAVESLEEEDKKLIILRYYKHMTQSQTAKVLNVTQVQVSRREKKILAVLRESLAV